MISKFLPHDTHTIWDKLPKCIFESFVEIAGVKQGHFQNFQKPQGWLVPNIAQTKHVITVNPLMSSVTFLYPLKTSENCRFSDVFREYKKVTLDINGLITHDHIKLTSTLY